MRDGIGYLLNSFDEELAQVQVQLTAQEAWEAGKRHLTNAGRIKAPYL